MLTEWFVRIVGRDPVIQGLAGGIVIAVMNTLGAALVVVWPNPSERALDGALGFAAGVMLSASFTSLILPGIAIGGIWPVLVGFGLGVVLLDQADQWVPHIHVVITGRNRAQNPAPSAQSGSSAADSGEPSIEEDTPTGR